MERFRGGFPATIDAKGRLKLPARLRELLEASYGREVYVCSFFPHELQIYPLPVWRDLEEQLRQLRTPAKLKLIERINYGQQVEVDDQGRILVPALLREMLEVDGDVVVSGRITHLAVTPKDRAGSFLRDDAPGEDEMAALAQVEL